MPGASPGAWLGLGLGFAYLVLVRVRVWICPAQLSRTEIVFVDKKC